MAARALRMSINEVPYTVNLEVEHLLDCQNKDDHDGDGRTSCSTFFGKHFNAIAFFVRLLLLWFLLLRFLNDNPERHPLPILNISEHLTRLQLQQNTNLPFGNVANPPSQIHTT